VTGRVVVVGLGPAGPELVTRETAALLDGARPVWLRTTRHPAAVLAPAAPTFDDVYERADTFADVYREITDRLIALAAEHGEVVYAVPGSPRVLERTVDLLAARAGAGEVDLDVRPALSFLDLAWVRLGLDPVEEGVRLVDGHRFAEAAAGERGPLLVAHCHNRRVLSDIKLAVDDPPSEPVLVVQRLGTAEESITAVPWAELDRSVEPDHLTSLYVPRLAAPVATEVVAFAELVRTLRERCPWDREQTHVTLSRHALEEAYEVVEAITAWSQATAEATGADGDGDALADAEDHLAEELGDLLFQVVFHATLGAERGAFTLADVARGIHDKLVRRHPHVFADDGTLLPASGAPPPAGSPGHSADASPAGSPGHSADASPAGSPGHSADASPAEDLARTWEQIKRAESGHASVMDGLTDALPSLLWAHKVLRKAEAVGHPWSPDAADPDDLGDQLLALVAVARADDVDPEAALRASAARLRDAVRAAGR
jgi:tetrapyrrole methylase family protein/MazG family protein